MNARWVRRCSIATAVVLLGLANVVEASVGVVKLTPEVAKRSEVAEVIRVAVSVNKDDSHLLEVLVTGPVVAGTTVRTDLAAEQRDGRTRLAVPVRVAEHVDTQGGQRVRRWSCSLIIDRELAMTSTIIVLRDLGPVATSYRIRISDFAPPPATAPGPKK